MARNASPTISIFFFWVVATIGVVGTADIPVGFKNSGDLFVVSPGDSVRFESDSMEWNVRYRGKQYRWCGKEITVGSITAVDGMSFRIRSDSASPLWLQIDESGGEGFYAIVTPNSQWQTVKMRLSSMKLNDEKVGNRKLDVEKIAKIVILDAAGLEDAKGRRKIWFKDWKWTSQATSKNAQGQRLKTDSSLSVDEKPARAKKLVTGKVGLSAVPPNYIDSDANYTKVFGRAAEAGVQVLSAGNAQWTDELEPRRGVYHWAPYEKFFKCMKESGHDFEVSFDLSGFFFHNEIRKPSHLRVRSITEPKYFQGYRMMAESFLERFADRIDYLVIHAEGSCNYFKTHPDHLDVFCRMLSELRKLVRKYNPRLKIGVNIDPFAPIALLKQVNKVVDFMGYDIMRSEELPTPGELEKMIEKLIRISGNKKIAIQNGGWSTSSVEKSSEEQQVQFIREFYRVLHKHRKEIEYASFFVLYDEDIEFMTPIYRKQVPGASKSFIRKMAEANGRFGLFRGDGTPKPGWQELKSQVAQYYQRLP